MTLDKNRKYEFAGDVYSWDETWHSWKDGSGWAWNYLYFDRFANKGLVKEVREPIVGRGRVKFDEGGDAWFSPAHQRLGISKDQARGRTFDIVATEVVE